MAIYLSMQRVRFSSPDAYEKFRTVFSNVRHHLMSKPGLHPSHVVGAPRRARLVQRSQLLDQQGGLNDWHMDTYHKHAKEWAANGAIMEDIITNFEFVATRLLRICPTCGTLQDKAYELPAEQNVLASPAPSADSISRYRGPRPTVRQWPRTSI